MMPSNPNLSAGSFAPYTPPPDDPSRQPTSRPSTVWSSQPSYQSGALGLPSSAVASAAASSDTERVQRNEWETTHGLRVDALAAFAYLLGPISAFILLVLEMHNDYVRFHGQLAQLLSDSF